MQAIKVCEGPSGSVFVLVSTDTCHAQLMLVGASGMSDGAYAETWNEAIRFCWGQGWEPRRDDADAYIASIDTEFYVLDEVDDEPEDEEVNDDDADTEPAAR